MGQLPSPSPRTGKSRNACAEGAAWWCSFLLRHPRHSPAPWRRRRRRRVRGRPVVAAARRRGARRVARLRALHPCVAAGRRCAAAACAARSSRTPRPSARSSRAALSPPRYCLASALLHPLSRCACGSTRLTCATWRADGRRSRRGARTPPGCFVALSCVLRCSTLSDVQTYYCPAPPNAARAILTPLRSLRS